MSKETPVLLAERRTRLGTRYARRLRDQGRLPAVIYGHRTEPVAVSLDAKQTLTTLRHGAHVLSLQLDGGATETCLVKDLQFGFLGDNVIHLDLTRVDLDEVVEVKIHLSFVGQPESSRKPGAIMVHPINELVLKCKVRDIPEEIRVDISAMEDEFKAGEVKLPANVTMVTPAEAVVCRVEIVKEEVAATPEAAATETTAAEPEVLTAKKDKEGAPPAGA